MGIGLVGMSSVLHGGGSTQVEISPEQMLLGMGLIVASQVSMHHHDPVLPEPPSFLYAFLRCSPAVLEQLGQALHKNSGIRYPQNFAWDSG